MSSEISIGQSAQALYENIKQKARVGYSVDSACSVSINTGTLGQTDTLSVASGSIYFGGSSVSVSAQNVQIDASDPDQPRKDVVYADGTGSALVAKGTPKTPPQEQVDSGATRFEFYQPEPPALRGTDAVVLAEVWVPEGASSISSADVDGRQVSTTVLPSFETDVDAKSNTIANLDSAEILSQLDIPVYSSDSNAPNETEYFHSSDNTIKYKDGNGNIYSSGGYDTVTTVTADYTASKNELVLVDASGGPVTVTLPAPEEGQPVGLEKSDSSSNTVTISPNSTENVNYASSEDLVAQGESVDLVSGGTDWYVI